MAKKQRDKMEFWKGRQKQKKQNRKKRNTLRQAFCGNKIDKKPLKLQEIAFLGLFLQNARTKTQRNKKQNHQKAKKTYQKKTFLHFEHYKNSVFSRTQLLGITDSKTPFRGKTPIFVVFGDFEWAPKKSTIFQKQIVATKMRTFFLPSEHKQCLPIFLKNDIFTRKTSFLHKRPKNTIFLGFFCNFIFPFFFMFSLFLSPT